MDISYIHGGPLWAEILVVLFGLFCLAEGLYFLKKEDAFFPIIHFHKEKNPLAYWVTVSFWVGMGLFLLVLGFVMIFLV